MIVLVCLLCVSVHLAIAFEPNGSPGSGFGLESNRSGCPVVPCSPGQRCYFVLNSNGKTIYACGCPSGYKGDKCDKDVNECFLGLDDCEQECKNIPGSYLCLCLSGYERHPTDHRRCVDVNECFKPHICAHKCYNTIGSYKCACYARFRLSEDKHSCRALSCLKPKLKDSAVKIQQSYPKYTPGDKIVFSCPKGYILRGSKEDICQIDESWQNHRIPPLCQEVPIEGKCKTPKKSAKTPTNRPLYSVGNVFRYHCAKSSCYPLFTKCTSTDTWSLPLYPCKGKHLKRRLANDPDSQCNKCGSISQRVLLPLRGARVTKSTKAVAGEFPWQALIRYERSKDKAWGSICAGSLIDPLWVLTAAHCFPYSSSTNVDLFTIFFGVRSQGPNGIRCPEVQSRKVRRIIRHPDFLPHRKHGEVSMDSDIALLQLMSPVDCSPFVKPICLPKPEEVEKGLSCIVAGWGRTTSLSNGRKTHARILRKTRIPIVDSDDCRRSKYYKPPQITENMLCAGYDDNRNPSKPHGDSCEGDSGSALVCQTGPESEWRQLGIVSFGPPEKCGMTYGVYTRVSAFVSWVKNVTEGE